MNLEKKPDIQERGYYSEEPVQLILAIYSKLHIQPLALNDHVKWTFLSTNGLKQLS